MSRLFRQRRVQQSHFTTSVEPYDDSKLYLNSSTKSNRSPIPKQQSSMIDDTRNDFPCQSIYKMKHLIKKGNSIKYQASFVKCSSQPDLSIDYNMKQRFQSESLLYTQHEEILRQTELPKEVLNQLNLLRCLSENTPNCYDPTLSFTLFNNLMELDSRVIRPLFVAKSQKSYEMNQDEIGKPAEEVEQQQTPIDRICLQHLELTLKITSEIMPQMIRKLLAFDSGLGLALENYWKYLQIILSLVLAKWSLNISKEVDEKTEELRKRIGDLQKENSFFQEQIKSMKLESDRLFRLEVDQQKQLIAQNIQMQNRINDFELQLHNLGDLEKADKKMTDLGKKVIESDKTIKKMDRQLVENRIDQLRQFKKIASVMIARKNEVVSSYVRLIDNLGSVITPHEKTLGVYLTQHPFISLYMVKVKHKEIDVLGILEEFFEYLTLNIIKVIQNGVNISYLFLNQYGVEKCFLVVEYLRSCHENQSEESIKKIFQILFAICKEQGVTLNTLLQLTKQIQGDVKLRTQIFVNLDEHSLFVRERLKNEERVFQYQLVLYILNELKLKEQNEWENQVRWIKERIFDVGIEGDWGDSQTGYNMKQIQIYLIEKQSIEETNKIDENFLTGSFDAIRQIMLLRPHIFLHQEMQDELMSPCSQKTVIQRRRQSQIEKRRSVLLTKIPEMSSPGKQKKKF